MSTALDRPVLSLADLEGYDPFAPELGVERDFLCPLPACSEKTGGARHRSMSVNVASGLWYCHRCQARGKLRERWAPSGTGRPTRQRATLLRAFALTAPSGPDDKPAA